ncbi:MULTISPECIES: type II toxin-antitoxin system VapB family antitoxin [unclassified Duganella]|jgi:Arc/MetJ family transcription regulator|uniref:type II toxin-antitoxin system VapB family antitoxin n=1 Tax=unclassified Duganella TaxID=2636909 RepID=UPI00087E5B0A|nr:MULTISPECIES: type II toxin-antitoxin system VapB family antitoxin [unclassified Duganella]SDF47968.1 antitoxin of type II TA system, VapB [Duganella sp. OV458]SDI78969.1 antitoxin of type II TA system, VapB [Duganella sp. OV510]
MQTTIFIDEKLMQETLLLTGLTSESAAVELGLRTVVRLKQQEKIREIRGKLPWEGNLDAMRSDK